MTTYAKRSVLALLTVATLAACDSGGGDKPDAPASSSTTGSSPTSAGGAPSQSSGTQSAPSDPVSRARMQLQQYDYAGATATLASEKSSDAAALRTQIAAAQRTAKSWGKNDQISHIFYHSLIVDSKRAFRAGSKRQGYLDYMVTEREFRAELPQIYAKGYVLVHPERIAAPDGSGKMTYRPIMLPPGKKPLVLSIDDVSYYEYMNGDGFASNLTLTKDGQVRNTYVDEAGKTHIGAYDVSTVIDDFVKEHPDFSYHGDKGSVALTGYNGILGYRSSYLRYGHNAKTEDARRKATAVADAMKKQGWNFACHSYGHELKSNDSLAKVKRDTQQWMAEVQPLVGKTPEMIYPFGADISGAKEYGPDNPKYVYYYGQGFRYFFNVDWSKPAWEQMTGQSLRQARIDVDGITLDAALAGKKTPLPLFFDPRSTVDPARLAVKHS